SASCARRDERGTRTSSPRSGRSSSRRRRERSGPGATSGSFGRLLARDGVSARAGLQVAERRLRDEQRAGPDDGAHLELRGSDDGDALEVAEALRERLLLVRDDEDERALVAPRLDEAGRGLGRGLRPRRAVDERERARLGMAREGAAEGRAPGLAVHLDVEAPHRRREGDPAAGPVRRTRRAGPGAPGALLTPRLRATAGDETPALGTASAGAKRVLLGAHRLVDEVRLHLGGEHGAVERHLLRRLAGSVEQRRLDALAPSAGRPPFGAAGPSLLSGAGYVPSPL